MITGLECNSSRIVKWVKEGRWIVFGQIVTVFGSLVLVRVVTEHLTPAQYGQLALGLTLAGLVKQVVIGGILNGVGRYYSIAAEKHDLYGYLKASWRLMTFAAVAIAAIGVVLIICLWLLGYSQWYGLAATTLIFSLFSSFNSSFNAIQNAARQRWIVAFHGGMDAWLKIPLVLGLILWLGASSTVVVLGYAFSSLLVAGSQVFFVRQMIPREREATDDSARWLKQIWSFSVPFMSWGVFTWAQLSSDRWFLESFAGARAVGLYTVLFQLGYAPVNMLTGLVIDFIGPVLFQRSGDARDQTRNRNVHRVVLLITATSVLLTGFGFLVASGMHGVIFKYLVAGTYRDASYLLPWMVVAGGLFATGQVLSLKLLSEMRAHAMIRVKIVTALAGIALNFVGAATFGLIGIVAAVLAFGAIYLVWMLLLTMGSRGDVTGHNSPARQVWTPPVVTKKRL